MNYLIVVDMQNDFIDGALGTKEAQAILPKVVEKVRNWKGKIIFTRDSHTEDYLHTQEGSRLPVPHCIKGTPGWQIAKQLPMQEDTVIIDKPGFGSVGLAEYLKTEAEVESIELVGLCTDICVIANAILLKSFFTETPISVDVSCCAGVTPESHQNALDAMKMCQIDVIHA